MLQELTSKTSRNHIQGKKLKKQNIFENDGENVSNQVDNTNFTKKLKVYK